MNDQLLIEEYVKLYRQTLLEDVVPFWMRHGFDRVHGGITNILDDAGNLLGTDKYLWSQGRALWTFSSLYNCIAQRSEWLEFADHIFAYLRSHGRDAQGNWLFRLNAKGQVLDGATSIYVDGFAMAGLTQYYAATKNQKALDLAMETYRNVCQRLEKPGSYLVAPYELPAGTKTHGVNMVFSLVFYDLGEILADQRMMEKGVELAKEVLRDFYSPEKNAILEFVTLDGRSIDSAQGRACVPGHVVESLWFLISIFERSGDINEIPLCCQLIKRHLELGWDQRSGGLILALDIDGQSPPYWKHATLKPWWVQVEALVATAYAYFHSREPWCLDWHERIHDFAFANYPVATGEWSPWLDEQGHRIGNPVVPVKDPFHLPRGLMKLIEVLERRCGAPR